MTYTIIDHGVWCGYTPNPLPEWAVQASSVGGAIIFFQRESDNVDFYAWRNTNPFKTDSIVAQTMVEGNTTSETVKGVYRDVTMLSPFNQRIIEIQGVDPKETKPHDLFAWMTYDPKTKTLSGEALAPQPPQMKDVTFKKDLWSRVTNDEADKIDTFLTTLPTREQRLFNDTVALIHTDELYTDLLTGLTKLFGADRATVILAKSN